MTLRIDTDPEPAAGVASLPMYDLPEVREATDALWGAIAAGLDRRGIAAPSRLDRSASIEALWSDPALLLSQTCGYPLMTTFRDRLKIVGVPVYAATGCEGPSHRAAIVVAQGSGARTLLDLKGGRCAINDPGSNTGMNLLREAIAPLAGGDAFFSDVSVTGSHALSLWRVGAGEADVAAIDAVTLALLQRHRPAVTERVRVLGWTKASPALPFVTSIRQPPEVVAALREALIEAVEEPSLKAAREALLLESILPALDHLYRPVLELAETAAAHGYPELR